MAAETLIDASPQLGGESLAQQASALPASAQPAPKASDIVFPSFFNARTDGLYVDAVRAAADTQFFRFVDGLLTDGFCFSGLDYAVFSRLLYPDAGAPTSKVEWIKIATRVAAFPEERRALYKQIELNSKAENAEYAFEPVVAEASDGAQAMPTKLIFDEFVAHLWKLGVRAGIDDKSLRRILDKGELGSFEVARWIEPSAGQDASIQEISDTLHRDNAPKQLTNGQIDLGHFKNRYPQVAKDTALIKKIPRVLGKPGRNLSGELLEPDLPSDFDFKSLAGLGTRIELRSDGEYIVSSMEGFLSLDSKTNQLSIVTKIVSHEGVSMRTTGDLVLTGDDYEEHGEVEEQRTVEGKNMTFCADVHGSLISRGGLVTLKQTFSKGKITNPQGTVVIEGRASTAQIEAPGGEIRLQTAEGCTISGKHVVIENAIRCQIVAEVLEIGNAEGCAVAGMSVKIGQCGERKNAEAVVSLFIPNLTELEEQRSEVNKQIAETQMRIQKAQREIDALHAQPEFAHFLKLHAKIASGEVKLNAAQQDNLKAAASRFANQLQQLRQLTEQCKSPKSIIEAAQQKLQDMAQQQASWAQDIHCKLEAISGETIVRTMRIKFGEEVMHGTPQEMLVKLRNLGEPGERLFSGRAGAFAWAYSAAKPATDDQ